MAMEHYALVQEMPTIERMSTQDRLKHARKRRSQQLKKWAQYERQADKESSSKQRKKRQQHQETQQQQILDASGKKRRVKTERVRFVANIALLESAARNDIEEVKRLLQSNISPDVTNEDGLTALHQCCIDDNEAMLKLLLDYGANVNACDSEMWTPLHAAATCGHVTLCKHLIDRGAELLAVNADGNMPYDICEDEITLDYIETEMAKNGITQEQIDTTRLTTERQMLNDLKELAATGGDLEIRDHQGASMLHIAAANGYLDVADFLLDHHVTVDARDQESWQPIHAASYWGQLDILELLVQNGADLDSKTKNGETPFDLSEDPDIKQRILDIKDEIETNKASRQRPGSSRRQSKQHSRNASMRRSSIRGEKSNLFKKEAQEEALHFGLRMLQDDEELGVLHEEKENLPATNIDDVTISFDDMDTITTSSTLNDVNNHHSSSSSAPQSNQQRRSDQNHDSYANTNSTHSPNNSNSSSSNKPQVAPRSSTSKQQPPMPAPRQQQQQPQQPEGILKPSQNQSAISTAPVNPTDAHFQSMFLESVPNLNRGSRGASTNSNSGGGGNQLHFYPPPMMEKAKNGQFNNNNYSNNSAVSATTPSNSGGHGGVQAVPAGPVANGPRSSFREGQLRRFVAPSGDPAVGADEDEKQRCCVIL
ncbi:protein phosphatase 1 regulatory subunit 16A [Elysia marginata]|uniref:Protein phosphatase 1 regulatory subunit 16A n=1 Tax=Elysia marginata TaxID=1093978 RepID=A0AAV4IAV0_9GAST|nr:protein phosphatase 1 regulatory subunit 16A [Elysia marginata]